ncbi:hypothetical protein [Planktothrix agardhii]|uniref:hypothetical protein n=1 Tax=Planktothrix agardhii TaxID=1160 RepID=UPI000487EB40|nr:hypothetical protein [Planktothrix agardhii]
MISLLLASVLFADVTPGYVPSTAPLVENEKSGACANNDYGANRFDVNGSCIYEVSGSGWFYTKNGESYGTTCSLSKEWCQGFSSKEQAIEASKK